MELYAIIIMLLIIGLFLFMGFGHYYVKVKEKEFMLIAKHHKITEEMALGVLWIKYFLSPKEGARNEKNPDNLQT